MLRSKLKWAASVAAIALALGAGVAVTGLGQTATAAATAKADGEVVALRRLTESQYRRTIADLFGPDIKMVGRFEPEARRHGLQAVASGLLSISATGFEQYYAMGKSVADQALDEKHRAKTMPCQPASATAPDAACTARTISHYGRMLFRRPLRDAEVQQRVALADEATRSSGSYYSGLSFALASVISSPDFLFRVEAAAGKPDRTGALALDSYTRASRLSYLLWNTTPDAELLAAAETGALTTPAGLKKQVDRLMASPRLEDGVRAFFSDMLQLDLFDTIGKDAAIYPKYSQVVAASAREQTLRTFVDHLLVKKADYRDLLTTRDTFVDRALASIYQVEFNFDGDWEPHSFAPDEDRSGVLTQVTFLSLFSHPGRSSPTKRGVAIYEVFMCQETPLPPANVDFSIVNDVSNPLLKTSRSRLLAHATDETCAGCHNLVDPAGLALERFDSVGQQRTIENGELIDVSAEIDGSKFAGATGLGAILRNNPRVPACLVNNVFAYGAGRETTPANTAFLKATGEAFAANGYRLPDLLRRIALSDELYRFQPSAEQPAPKTDKKVAGLDRATNSAGDL